MSNIPLYPSQIPFCWKKFPWIPNPTWNGMFALPISSIVRASSTTKNDFKPLTPVQFVMMIPSSSAVPPGVGMNIGRDGTTPFSDFQNNISLVFTLILHNLRKTNSKVIQPHCSKNFWCGIWTLDPYRYVAHHELNQSLVFKLVFSLMARIAGSCLLKACDLPITTVRNPADCMEQNDNRRFGWYTA